MRFLRLTLGMLIILLASHAQAQTALLWKWKQGDKLTYVLEDNDLSKSAVGNQVFDLSQTLLLDTTWHVKSVGPTGEAGIVVTIERVRFTADGKGGAAIGKISFDSKDEAYPESKRNEAIFSVLNSFPGAEITLTVSAQGSVSKFELPEGLASTMEDNTTRELAGFFGDAFTADGVRHRLINWLVALPNEPVSENESWREDKLSRLGKSVTCVHSYTLGAPVQRDGHSLMKINVKPELKLLLDNGGKENITEQDGEGVVYFDSRTGCIVESVLTHHAILEAFSKTTLDAKTTVKLATESNK